MKVRLVPETKPYSDIRGDLPKVITDALENAPILAKTNIWHKGCVLVDILTVHGQHLDWFYINPIHLEEITND